jgi:hypothetical protein
MEMEYDVWKNKHKNRILRWLFLADVNEQDLHLKEGWTIDDYVKYKIYVIVVCSILGLMVLGLILVSIL